MENNKFPVSENYKKLSHCAKSKPQQELSTNSLHEMHVASLIVIPVKSHAFRVHLILNSMQSVSMDTGVKQLNACIYLVIIYNNKNSSADEIASVNFYAVRPGNYPNSLK